MYYRGSRGYHRGWFSLAISFIEACELCVYSLAIIFHIGQAYQKAHQNTHLNVHGHGHATITHCSQHNIVKLDWVVSYHHTTTQASTSTHTCAIHVLYEVHILYICGATIMWCYLLYEVIWGVVRCYCIPGMFCDIVWLQYETSPLTC